MAPTIMNTVPLGILPESIIYGLPFLDGGVILGMTEDDVELDEGNAEEDEETADVIMLVELAVVAVEAVVNFGKPLLLMVINVIFS